MEQSGVPGFLTRFAEDLGRSHCSKPASRPPPRGSRELRQNIAEELDGLLAALRSADSEAVRELRDIEWLLDNTHVVREALAQLKRNLPTAYYRQLQHISSERGSTPRVLEFMRALLQQCGLPIDLGWLEHASVAYQSTCPLTLGELWALPTLLRAAVLEQMCRSARDLFEKLETQSVSDSEHLGEVAGCIISLREIVAKNWPDFVERVSLVDDELRKDASGHYAQMDFATRDQYRKRIEQASRRCRVSEREVAQRAVELSRRAAHASDDEPRKHVGYYLIDSGFDELENLLGCRPRLGRRITRATRHVRETLYVATIVIPAVSLTMLLCFWLWLDGRPIVFASIMGLPLLIVLVGLCANITNWALTLLVEPRLLPKLDYESDIPDEWCTAVVIPGLLSDKSENDALLRILEINYLGNPQRALRYVLLSDFTDADSANLSVDQELLDHAIAGIDRLNARYTDGNGQPFSLLHRKRLWNESERRWMGWERKRGKLSEFNRWLRDAGETSFCLIHGDTGRLRRSRLVITLDADTQLPVGTAAQLIGALAHPLNRPVVDSETSEIRRGYSVIQPRVDINPLSANQTRFSRLLSGDVSLDLYTHAVSDVYQDCFGEGVFAGKGIYDIDAFEMSLQERIPENTVLSHDMLEGLHGRVGFISDVGLLEDYPARYSTYLRRAHRWIRGDWQLLRWALGRGPVPERKFRPGLAGRWKLIENLRRSLTAPAALALLLLSWTLPLPFGPVWWTVAVMVVYGVPTLAGLWTRLAHGNWRWGTIQTSAHALISSIGLDVARLAHTLAFLPCEAFTALDAVLRTLFRMFISRRQMLEWTTASQAAREAGQRRASSTLSAVNWAGPLAAVVAGVLVLAVNNPALWVAGPFLFAWFLSPAVAAWLARVAEPTEPQLATREQQELRALARRTWSFFERYVNSDSAWLPPDNVQLAPVRHIAQRTSPTNIGLALLSTVSAYELGYLGVQDMVARVAATISSLLRLAMHRGHLYNWYSLTDFTPLDPRYVSAVDSGNFIASLIVLRQALLEIVAKPLPTLRRQQGLVDCLEVLLEETRRSTSKQRQQSPELRRLTSTIEAMKIDLDSKRADDSTAFERNCDRIEQTFLAVLEADDHEWSAEDIAEFRGWILRLRRQHRSMRRDHDTFIRWQEIMDAVDNDSLSPEVRIKLSALRRQAAATSTIEELRAMVEHGIGVPGGHQSDAESLARLRDAMNDTHRSIDSLLETIESLSETLWRLIQQTNFKFLYDPNRHLLHIGYNVSTGELDGSYYDLLASEARLASFIAIAKNDVPRQHWLHLGRPLTRIHGMRVLLSWSATAFEYLMPRIVMVSPRLGLLDRSCRAAVHQQIRFARRHKIPWGISESGYYHFDEHGNYQYRAFGVPRLGLKRGQGDRLVVSPYASILGLPFAPRAVLENLGRLRDIGLMGTCGLSEAVDFGHPGSDEPARPRIVRSYMAHHQSMIMASLCNTLTGDRLLDHFGADPIVAGAEFLLYEQLPRVARTDVLSRAPIQFREPAETPRGIETWQIPARQKALTVLSNEHFSVMVTSDGGGGSEWNGSGVVRWQPEVDGSIGGSLLYLKNIDTGDLWSIGAQTSHSEALSARLGPHIAELTHHRKNLLTRLEIAVAPHSDLEIRRVSLTNESNQPIRMQIATYSEILLGNTRDYQRHPRFSKLFIESGYSTANDALLFRRRARSPDEHPLYLAQAAVADPASDARVHYESDRRRFLGRLRTTSDPVWFRGGQSENFEPLRYTLDPTCTVSLVTEIQPNATFHCAFLTAVGDAQGPVLETLGHFRSLGRVAWAIDQARIRSERELHDLDLSSEDVKSALALLATVMWTGKGAFQRPENLPATSAVQDYLWRHGISGDRPIIVARIEVEKDLTTATRLVNAQRFWNSRGVTVDLLLMDDSRGGYYQPVSDRLQHILEQRSLKTKFAPRGLLQVLAGRHLDPIERQHLISSARVYLDRANGPYAEQLRTLSERSRQLPPFIAQASSPLTSSEIEPVARPTDLLFDNGIGGFSADGKEYVIAVDKDLTAPSPWSNVLANPCFGAIVTEAGGTFTWFKNSSEYRLTPWRNDPVTDGAGEGLYVRDEETGAVWSPCGGPRRNSSRYLVRHAPGYTRVEHNSNGLEQVTTQFVDPTHPVKFIHVKLRNRWPRVRRVTVTYAAEWVLGNDHIGARRLLVPEHERESQALLVRNAFDRVHTQRTAFLSCSRGPHGLTTDLLEFLGDDRSWTEPAALWSIGVSDYVGPSSNPGAVYQVHVNLAPDETTELHFALGISESRAEAVDLARSCRDDQWMAARLREVDRHWEDLLGRCLIETPDRALDVLFNRWLPYQVIASRLWARAGYYQTAGGYGYRDQLQDVMALLPVAPEICREHILRAASMQFEDGDVLHWWHPDPVRGVRTRVSDDLLWLPFVAAAYVTATGDSGLLNETVPYLSGPPLEETESEHYGEFATSSASSTVYEHCFRAIDARLTVGRNGLPLFGTGDWNDGLNRVGRRGKGESVWLAWFLAVTCRRFGPICEAMQDPERALQYRRVADTLVASAESSAWSGDRYLRGFYDDGTPLGHPESEECKIDLNAQTWAVFAGADSERTRTAMDTVERELADADLGLIKLLTPPFQHTSDDPGYIKAYPPGVRENGGQYTHAAVWAVWAAAELGRAATTCRWLEWLNPITHSDTPMKIAHYGGEPYVLAGDIYGEAPLSGMAGWTWYTGAAGWMYQIILTKILGLEVNGETLRVKPLVPDAWRTFRIDWRYKNARYRIQYEAAPATTPAPRQVSVSLDGVCFDDGIPLSATGEHDVVVSR